jgi:hypothetical protein
MKKVFALILLICHMNTSMFLPQIQEQDVYDVNGQQVDDINSIVELINVELGYDKTADDEDDDNGQSFHLVKSSEYSFQQQSVLIERTDFTEIKNTVFSEYKIPSVKSISLDILTPPPDFI